MRVCTLVDRFPPLVGGAELQAKQLSSALVGHGLSVMVMTRRVHRDLPGREIADGLTIYRVPPGGKRSHINNILAVIPFIVALIRHRRQYDLLHVHDMFSLLLAAIIVKVLLRKPVVVKVPTHGNVLRHGSVTTKVSFYSRLLHHVILPRGAWLRLLHQVDAFVAISDEIEAELKAVGLGHKVERISNAVDTTRFFPADTVEKHVLRRELGLPEAVPLLISHGRIVERKRLDVLIHAVARARQTCPQLYVVLPGPFYPDGTTLEGDLKGLIATLQLEKHVVFAGPTQRPEAYLRSADVFVLASEREGMPNALLEAMACGLICIASDIGGVTDVIDHGRNGWLFSVADVEALAGCITQAVMQPETASRMGEAALASIQSVYTWAVIVPRYVALYERLLSKDSISL